MCTVASRVVVDPYKYKSETSVCQDILYQIILIELLIIQSLYNAMQHVKLWEFGATYLLIENPL